MSIVLTSTNRISYRVQTGAFKNLANAKAQREKVKAAGFDTYLVQSDGYCKVQVGAFAQKANAND